MPDNQLPRPTAKQILKAVFWNRWVAIVGAVLGIFGILDFVDAHFAPRFPTSIKDIWSAYYVLPSFGWRTWLVIISLALLVVAVHGAYVYAKSYSEQYQQLTKNKVIFELDEITTRVFVREDPPLITAWLKLRFQNKEQADEHIKTLRMALYDYSTGKEVFSWIIDDRYYGANEVEIPRDAFEGMLIQAKRLTPWYFCHISIDVASSENFKLPKDLTETHHLQVIMTATNQEEFKTRIFVNWEKAQKPTGTAIRSIGAPAIRPYENRRIKDRK